MDQGGRNLAGDVSGADHWRPRRAQRPVGWQPSRFLADRAEAERAFRLAEWLGSVNAAAQELGTTWSSLRKAFVRHGLGCRRATPWPSGGGRSRPPASAATGRPRRPWTRCLWPSTPALSRLGNGMRPSCMSGPARGARHLGRQRGGRAEQRKPRPPTRHPRLGDHPPGQPRPPSLPRPRTAWRPPPH
jgi:hypothetical protein